MRRFYCESIPVDAACGAKVILDNKQSRHLKNTLRLKERSLVELFDNRQRGYVAEVCSIPATPKKGGVELIIISQKKESQATLKEPDITLACAIPKGYRMDYLIEKTAEIGLKRVIPLITERTVVRTDISSRNKIERWRQIAISSAKQSCQDSILEIGLPIRFKELCAIIKDFSLSLIALPSANKYLSEVLGKDKLPPKILYIIGPEGDFTADEVSLSLKWGALPVRLPVNSVLRVETAAITMLAMMLYHFSKVISR
ncbi:MAG: RsmE family RNA methyltransferase [Planctomycetota bacterium]|nr:RsmE family RNA methyltransferase [Planctomycetota bacterium]MDI6787084.1 RsmE family RNA methyltransferase [Planctomycetota bacterium]